jgi:hypothetical protein
MVGSALAADLRSDGHDVVGISRTRSDDTIVWDVDAGEVDATALESLDAVVHLAGETIQGRWTKAKKQRILRSRVDSTALLARALGDLDDPPSVFVCGSAVGYYGDRGDELLDETSSHGAGFLAEVVRAWELSSVPIEDLGVRVTYARTSLVLTPRAGALGRMRAITRWGLGGPLGGGRQFWSWVTLDDEVRALRLLIESEIEGPANIASPGPVRQGDFARILAAALERPAIVPAPAFAIRAALGEMGRELLLDSVRARSAVLEGAGFEFESPDLAAAFDSMFAG